MNDSDRDALKSELQLDEGSRNSLYDDATGMRFKTGDTLRGNLTIGIGCNLMEPVSDSVINMLYEEKVCDAIDDLERFAWFSTLDGIRQRALANMRYAIGGPAFRGFVKMIAACADGRWQDAGTEFLDSQLSWQPQRKARIYKMLTRGSV